MAPSVSREIPGPQPALSEESWPAAIAELARRYGLDGRAGARLERLVQIVSRDPHAPTTVRVEGDVVRRHLADSLVALEVDCVRGASRVADLGSGGGMPGAVLAVALPSARVSLVEARSDKCGFLARLVAGLELANTSVVCARAEQWHEGVGENDLVVARALAAQPVVMEYAAPLLMIGGHLVEWRGRREQKEELAAGVAAAELGLGLLECRKVEPFAGAQEMHLHVFEKVAETPPRFPRRPGVAVRRPLGH